MLAHRGMLVMERWNMPRTEGADREISGRPSSAARPQVAQPTVFVPARRGEDISWKDVVARKV